VIDKALDIIQKELYAYLSGLPGLDVTVPQLVKATHLVKQEGGIAIESNTLGITLVNIEEERVNKPQSGYQQGRNGRVGHMNPEMHLNLYFLVTPNCTDYGSTLKLLSGAVSFFQAKNVFTPENSPGMDPGLEKLIVDMHTLTLEQQNHLWGYLGAKYMPSVLFKARYLTVQEGWIRDDQPPVLKPEYLGRAF
jgi:hypothetical protein